MILWKQFQLAGKIQPQTEIKISADVSGEIVELFVEGRRLCNKRKFIAKR